MPLSTLERAVYESPDLWSWFSADNLVDGSGNYADKGPRGNNWLQATPANQPALVTNWMGLGVNAVQFDGSTTSIKLNARAPVAAITCLALFNLSSLDGVGSGLYYTLAGSTDSGVAPLQDSMRMANRKFMYFIRNASSSSTPAQAINVPLLATFVYNPIAKNFGCRINGGPTWYTVPITWQTGHFNTSLTLGCMGGNGTTAIQFFQDPISEFMVFKCALSDPRFYTELYNAEHCLAARGGITLPY